MTAREQSTSPKVTLGDVAIAANVSPAAASLALRGRRGVSDATRERIIETANEMGYRSRSAIARAENLVVGVLLKAKREALVDVDAFYGPVLAGITTEASTAGVELRLDSLLVDDDFDPVEVPRSVQSDDVDGLLVLGTHLTERSQSMIAPNPVVLVDGYADSPWSFSSVVANNKAGTQAATQHLIDLGHRRIAMVGTRPDSFPSIVERRLGYESAMVNARLDPVFIDSDHDESELAAEQFMVEFERQPGLSAVVAANDDVAISLMRSLGSEVPNRISVVGFDDITAASLIRPRLTTVTVDKPALGRLALSLVTHRIRHPEDPPVTAMVPAVLTIRESSVAPPPGY